MSLPNYDNQISTEPQPDHGVTYDPYAVRLRESTAWRDKVRQEQEAEKLNRTGKPVIPSLDPHKLQIAILNLRRGDLIEIEGREYEVSTKGGKNVLLTRTDSDETRILRWEKLAELGATFK